MKYDNLKLSELLRFVYIIPSTSRNNWTTSFKIENTVVNQEWKVTGPEQAGIFKSSSVILLKSDISLSCSCG